MVAVTVVYVFDRRCSLKRQVERTSMARMEMPLGGQMGMGCAMPLDTLLATTTRPFIRGTCALNR